MTVFLLGFAVKGVANEVVDLNTPTDTTLVELNKRYAFAERSKQYPIRFVAEADGYLTLSGSQKISASSLRRNGTSIQTGGSMYYTDADKVKHTVEYFGAYTKDNATGKISGLAVAKGDVVECKVSTSVAPTADAPIYLDLEFTEGTNPLALVGVLPENGSEWSGAMKYKTGGVNGAIYCSFSSLVDIESVKAIVKVGDKKYTDVEVAVESYYSYLYLKGLSETLKAAAAEGLISAGETFTVTLTGLKDRIFPDRTLEDQTFTYTMGNTSCTGVTPTASTSLVLEKIQNAVFSFDGKVNIDNAKFYMINLADNSTTELTATVEGVNLVIPVASSIKGMMPRLFDIVAEGVVDAQGNPMTYSTTASDAEEGKLKAHYGMGLTPFAPVAVPAKGDTVYSLKTFTLTYPIDVIYNASAASSEEIKLTQNYGDDVITTGTLAVSETDAKVVTITLAEEIKTPGVYALEVPSKLLWANDAGYNADDLGTKGSSKYGYYQASMNWSYYITPFEPKTVTPAAGSTARSLDLITLTFSEDIDFDANTIVTVISGEMGIAPETLYTGKLIYHESDYDKLYVKLDETMDSAGEFRVIIPAEAIWDDKTKEKKTPELGYNYTIDPEYWDSEWVYEVGSESQSEETPFQLIAGRKYKFSQIHNYAQYTAEETGRLVFTPLEESKLSLTCHNEEWEWLKKLNVTADGEQWLGVEAGKTYNIKDYIMFGTHTFKLTFEPGAPYEPIQFVEASPANGEAYSTALSSTYSNTNGAVEFVFTNQVNTDMLKVTVVLLGKENKKIDITGKVGVNAGNAWKNFEQIGYYYAVKLADIIGSIINENGLKSGDKIQVVLENIQDADYASNTLEGGVSTEITLVATVCTSVEPNPAEKVAEVPTTLTLCFNNQTTGTGGRLIDTKSGKEVAFDASCFSTSSFENWTGITIHETTVTLPAGEFTPTSRQFAIVLEGMADKDGNVVTYGDEEGKFVLNYSMKDDTFVPIATTPEEGGSVSAIKETRLTFADKANIAPNAGTATISNYDDINVEGTLSIDPADPKTVIITWSEEITKAGEYYISLGDYNIYDSKFDASKEDYGLADGASANPYLLISCTIAADLSITTVESISPENYESNGSTVEQLPAEVTITFSGNPQSVKAAYGFGAGGMTPFNTATEEIPEGTDALTTTINGNQVTVSIPESVIKANTVDIYTIVLSVVGEDGKLVGGNLNDPYDNHVQFSYFLMDELTLTASDPADNAQVESLKDIVLTFETDLYATYDPYMSTDEIEGWEMPMMLTRTDEYKVVAERLVPTIAGKQATISLPEAITEDGIYQLSIPGGVFYEKAFEGSFEPLKNGAKTLTFTIGNVVAKELAIEKVTPENGSSVETLTTVELTLNKSVGYLYKSMLIGDNGEDAHGAELIQSATDPKSYTLDFTYGGLFENVILKKGVTYTMTLEAYSSEDAYNFGTETPETVTLTYQGASAGYTYSEVKLESITPNEDFVISDKSQNKFVVKFSDAVTIVEELTYINMGQGATQPFQSIVSNDAKTEYTLIVAETVLAGIRGTVNLVLAADDANGLRVMGNNGEGKNSTFAFYYTTTIGVPDLTITPDATAELASLETISIKCSNGLMPSWTAGHITLTNEAGESIALNDPEAVVAEGASEWDTPVEWSVSLQEKLNTIGTYKLTIPAGYFNIGSEQGQVLNNKETVVVFNITAAAQSIKGIQVNADTEVTVYNVTGIAVATGKASQVLKNLTKGIYIVNGRKVVIR